MTMNIGRMKVAELAFLLLSFLGASVSGKVFQTLSHLKPQHRDAVQSAAVQDLLYRLIGDRAAEFQVSVNNSLAAPDGLETYELRSVGAGKVAVVGSTGVAAATGCYNYLKYFCGCHISWSGVQLQVPSPLPRVPYTITVKTPNRFRYYQNVCTSSYSFVWWDWARWEKEIDWMALNGINMPLAFTGQEAIWQRVFLTLGLNQSEIDDFFTGPAFLAWGRMGNIHTFGGPLSANWMQKQLSLQNKIVERMRSLGMITVLPAFAGHIPQGLLRVFPKVNVTRLGGWANFNCTYSCSYLLDPEDPLFQKIGGLFMTEMIREFGTDHIYNADTFNEMTPTSSDPAYLSAVSKAIFKSMYNVDPGAIWLMQGWLFVNNPSFWKPEQIQALLLGAPIGKMIVLDLAAENSPIYQKTKSFYGQPFIWCMLHNFGGNHGLYGKVDTINTGPFEAMSFKESTMVGTGLTPEGIEQNDMIYELMNEIGWRSSPLNLTDWISGYSTRRYGQRNLNAVTAWQLLLTSVYNCTQDWKDHNHSPLVRRPSLRMNIDVCYNDSYLFKAWKYMYLAAPSLSKSSTFLYDLVDVTREVMQQLVTVYYLDIKTAYESEDLEKLMTAGGVLVYDLLSDFNDLLSSQPQFLLGKWLDDASKMAVTEKEASLYDMNARNQITLWGPTGNILDYANKQFGGLVQDYYAERWSLFLWCLIESLNTEIPFHQDKFNQAVSIVEKEFIYNGKKYSTTPTGDTLDIVKNIFIKYHPENVKDNNYLKLKMPYSYMKKHKFL
ncbi:alpha-N-acetylglucosaminidase [Engystomops pustulosus]|uniref:alpha-N-acetylglucosaminidase n=1 Tax=Engystomops pustulosus TaxID=76066 RepID=UPI003AFA9F5E